MTVPPSPDEARELEPEAIERAMLALITDGRDGAYRDAAHAAAAVLLTSGLPSQLAEWKRRAEAAHAALWRCVELSGADTSDGIPTWPSLPVLAVEEVTRLREEADDATDIEKAEAERDAALARAEAAEGERDKWRANGTAPHFIEIVPFEPPTRDAVEWFWRCSCGIESMGQRSYEAAERLSEKHVRAPGNAALSDRLREAEGIIHDLLDRAVGSSRRQTDAAKHARRFLSSPPEED